jgi:trehalose 6-phosphate phosphatase
MTTLPDMPDVERAAYLLDFDGTLVDIAPRPDAVVIPPGLPEGLRRLRARTGGAVAIVTGRPLADIVAFLGDAAGAVAAEHGSVLRLADGGRRDPDPRPQDASLLARAEAAVRAHPGALLERKTHGFVLHFRGAPEAGPELEQAARAIAAASPGLRVLAAKMAWELRPEGVDKGTAVRALMREPPFTGRVPVFVGDDRTDEDGMDAARALGGVGLRVDQAFGDPAGVRAWLAGLA